MPIKGGKGGKGVNNFVLLVLYAVITFKVTRMVIFGRLSSTGSVWSSLICRVVRGPWHYILATTS